MLIETKISTRKVIIEKNGYEGNNFFWHGWIEDFDEDGIICLLEKDFECDMELTIGRGLLTKQQNEMVSKGLVVRFNKRREKIEFMSEDGNG